jgi:uncharacterized protein
MPEDGAEAISVAVLARAPFPGTVKTRLVFMLGVDGAAELEARLIRRTVEVAVEADVGPVTLWTSPGEPHPLFEELAAQDNLRIEQQPDGDLGVAIYGALVGSDGPALVLQTDCPVLRASHLRDAADVLRSEADAVVIPSDDGGYVLIGMRTPSAYLFPDMPWHTDAVMVETRRRLSHLGIGWREPASLWTIDRPTDVRRLRREGIDTLLQGLGHTPVSMFEQLANTAPAA